jgi:hypothetical protein
VVDEITLVGSEGNIRHKMFPSSDVITICGLNRRKHHQIQTRNASDCPRCFKMKDSGQFGGYADDQLFCSECHRPVERIDYSQTALLTTPGKQPLFRHTTRQYICGSQFFEEADATTVDWENE